MNTKLFGYAFLAWLLLAQPVFAQEILPIDEPASADSATAEPDATEPAATEPTATLIISAVQITGGTGKTAEDFIELYNSGDEPTSLAGYRLVKRTAAGSSDTIIYEWAEESEAKIEPGRFLLWSNATYTDLAIAPDVTSVATLADNNGIALRFGTEESGEIIDSVAWGSTANGFENVSGDNPPANKALMRLDLLDRSAGFVIAASSPRNSSYEFAPDENPAEETSPEEPPAEEGPEPEEGLEPEPEPEPLNIIITELLPNPSGSDSGAEKIELFNAGTTTANLTDYKLDDILPNQPLSSNAYIFSETSIKSGEYLVVVIPAGLMTLNNTGGDAVTLFDQNNISIASASYEGTAPENQSYSLYKDEWFWGQPTFGLTNTKPVSPATNQDDTDESGEDEEDANEADNENTEDVESYDNSGLEITEIFPQPPAGNSEFVEIRNSGTEVAQLSQVTIYVGERKKLLPEYELMPGQYFVVGQNSLPIQLRNSGQTIKLMQNSVVLSEVDYGLAMVGASFAKFEDGFLWTTEVTEGQDNILNLPEQTKAAAKLAAAASATAKSATTKTAAKAATKTAAAQTTTKATAAKTDATQATSPQPNGSKPAGTPLAKVLGMGAAAVAAGVAALYKFLLAGLGQHSE